MYWALLSELARYEWGLSIFNSDSKQIQLAMPNKVYDYIAAGIPVIASLGTSFGNFVESEGIGVAVDPKKMPKVLPDSTPYRQRVLEVRGEHALNVTPLEELYEAIA
jgi:hypothetical protein